MFGFLFFPFKIAYFKYKKSQLSPVRPWFINFITTFQCNSCCTMCGIWRRYVQEPQKLKEELTLSEIKKFLLRNNDYLKELKHIGLTGGEPFLRDDIVDIVKAIREIVPHVRTGIQTNGLLDSIKDKVREIVRFYPEFGLAVSIDGTSKTHDLIRGQSGAFDKAVSLIQFARSLNVSVTAGMTINRLNFREILEVKQIASDLGAEFSCFLAEEAPYFNNRGSDCGLDEDMKRQVCAALKAFGYHYYMDNLRLFIEGKRVRPFDCYSGYSSLVIDPYGNVKPCILKEEAFGNVRDQTLREMLSSDKARMLRGTLQQCSCWCQCEVSASAIVDPTDVARWFIFACCDKKQFLTQAKKKLGKISV